MKVGDLCDREVILVEANDCATEVAALMREHDTNCVLVVDKSELQPRPIGMVTRGDLVNAIVAPNLDASAIPVKDFMSDDLVLVAEDETLWAAAELMREEKVRQVPVVDANGFLQGMFYMDDVLQVVTAELADLMSGSNRDGLSSLFPDA